MLSANSEKLVNIQGIIESIFGTELHKKRQLSLAYATLGLFESKSLFLHEMGLGMAEAEGLTRNMPPNKVLPEGVKITVVADRGFADRKFFNFLEEDLQFNYIIRIKSSTTITTNKGISKKAWEWLEKTGRANSLKEVTLTQKHHPIKQFVSVKDKGMKSGWFLVTNVEDVASRLLIKHYAKRWKIEPYFRDIKDGRYGYGLRKTHIKSEERRDRLFFIVALCYTGLLLLGQAGENIGFDKYLKVNTVKTRTHSLFRQGQFYLSYFKHFKPEQQKRLIESFSGLLANRPFWLAFYDINK